MSALKGAERGKGGICNSRSGWEQKNSTHNNIERNGKSV